MLSDLKSTFNSCGAHRVPKCGPDRWQTCSWGTIITFHMGPTMSYTLFTLQTEAKRSEPYCRIHTIHTSTECAAMRIPQFDSFHTAHSRMRFVSHWKRSELFSVVMGSAILFNAVSRPICLWGRLTFTTFICMSLLYIFIIP